VGSTNFIVSFQLNAEQSYYFEYVVLMVSETLVKDNEGNDRNIFGRRYGPKLGIFDSAGSFMGFLVFYPGLYNTVILQQLNIII